MSKYPGSKFVLAAGCCAALFTSLSEGRAQSKAAAPISAEEKARRALVVAQFDDTQITVGQIETAILEQNPFMQKRYLAPEAVRAMLDRSLRFELLAAEARRRGYDKHEDVQLAVKQNAVQSFIKHEFDDKFTEDSIPPQDIKKYYDEHLDEFVRPESRRASLLIVATEPEAKALLVQARAADLRTFRELARTKSLDESNKQRGGDLGYFEANGHLVDAPGPTDSIDPALAKATFALKSVGDTSGVVRAGERFAIVRLAG
ncbi:MAG TPA: peptidyl-prolyl cis-trans isomerase, partial [Polyangiales bacterium]